MRITFGLILAVSLMLVGCGETTPPAPALPAASTATLPPSGSEVGDSGGAAAVSDSGAVPATLPPEIEQGKFTLLLSPANTKIEFVGTHVGEKPDPRKGGFDKFTGKLELDLAAKSLKSISLDIETESLRTEIAKLTEHLKSPDFFEVREYPKATFESTKIVPSAETPGQLEITGNLTLHGVTKEITAPATVQVGPAGPGLTSEFMLDRSQFGMTYSPDKVENKVALTVVIGQSAPPAQP
jgi:polyisoprenoid-binding protein YceI